MPHNQKSPIAGKTVTVKATGQAFRVDDWYDRVFLGHHIFVDHGSVLANEYNARRESAGLPADDEVLYGKIGIVSHAFHVSELDIQNETPAIAPAADIPTRDELNEYRDALDRRNQALDARELRLDERELRLDEREAALNQGQAGKVPEA